MNVGTMRPGEYREVTFRYSKFPEIVAGDTLQTFVDNTARLLEGDSGSPPEFDSDQTVDGSDVKVFVTIPDEAPLDTRYVLAMRYSTAGGSVLKAEGIVEVNDR